MSLKKKTVTGFIWTSVGTFGNGIISLLVTMILSRILTPYDFALIALINVFLIISNVIVESGFSQAIIRDDSPSETDLSSVFYFNTALSFFLYLVFYLLAPNISAYFESPELTNLSRVIFLVIIFNSFTIIQTATLNRNLNFEVLNKASVLGSVFAGSISIIMAITGFGIWALVANSVLLPLFRSVLLWYFSKWRPTTKFSFTSIKQYLSFSVFLLFQGIVEVISNNLITLIIGKIYTKDDLGYYSLSQRMDNYILIPFNSIVQKVTYPILAKIKEEEIRLKDAYRQVVSVVMFAFIPASIFTIVTAENMIFSLFGSQWIEAGTYLKIAAFGTLLYPLQVICVNLLLLKGKSKRYFHLAFLKHGLRILLVLVFIKQGTLILATVFSLSNIFGSAIIIISGMSSLEYTFIELMKDIHKSIFASILTASLVAIVGYIPIDYKIVLFLIQCFIMTSVYLIISKSMKNESYNELTKLLKPMLLKFRK